MGSSSWALFKGEFVLDVAALISDLRRQRDDLSQAIIALERFSISGAKRRGRPRAEFKVKPKKAKDHIKTAAHFGQ
jgi:hypothetical protein